MNYGRLLHPCADLVAGIFAKGPTGSHYLLRNVRYLTRTRLDPARLKFK
jgi:hypothetical protein